MDWNTIIEFDSCQEQFSPKTHDGWIVEWPNQFSDTVHVSSERGSVFVSMPWADRFHGFAMFLLKSSSTFRIFVDISNDVITKYRLQVHSPTFSMHMGESGCVPGEIHVLDCIREHLKRSKIGNDNTAFLHECKHLDLRTSILTTSHFILKPHQEESVSWMQEIENNISDRKNSILYSSCIPIPETDWGYDCYSDCFVPYSDTAWLKARYRGGILTDSNKSGKTVAALYLIASTTFCYIPTIKNMISTGATLVIVPPSAFMHWISEIDKFFGNELRVVHFSDLREAKKYNLQNCFEADIVLTTSHFLNSKPYSEALETAVNIKLGNDERKRCKDSHVLRTTARVFMKQKDYDFPLVEMIHWKRVIIDDIHLLFELNKKDKLKNLRTLQASFWWGLTASPDVSTTESSQSLYFLLMPKLCGEVETAHHPCLLQGVEQTLMRSHYRKEVELKHILHQVPDTEAKQQESQNNLTLSNIRKFIGREYRMKLIQGIELASVQLSQIKYINSSLNIFEHDIITTCSICETNVVNAIAKCAHSFCTHCAKRIVETAAICPMCKAEFTHSTYCRWIRNKEEESLQMGMKTFFLLNLIEDMLQKHLNILVLVRTKASENEMVKLMENNSVIVKKVCNGKEKSVVLISNLENNKSEANIPNLHTILLIDLHIKEEHENHFIRKMLSQDIETAIVHHVIYRSELQDWKKKHPSFLILP